jgi:CRISPR-associated protein Csd2
VIVFSHGSKLGTIPAHKLFDTIHVQRRQDRDHPRGFQDYDVQLGDVPDGVTRTRLVG